MKMNVLYTQCKTQLVFTISVLCLSLIPKPTFTIIHNAICQTRALSIQQYSHLSPNCNLQLLTHMIYKYNL